MRLQADLLVAEVLVGLATDTVVYVSRREEALQVNILTFAIRASEPVRLQVDLCGLRVWSRLKKCIS